MEDAQLADLDPTLDLAPGEPEVHELCACQHSVLTTGQPDRRTLPSTSVVALTTHMVVEATGGGFSPPT